MQNKHCTFTFAVARPSSVCRLSVAFVHPTQPVEIFGSISIYAVWYLDHPLKFTENVMEIVPGEAAVGGLNARGVANLARYSEFEPIESYISETVQDRR